MPAYTVGTAAVEVVTDAEHRPVIRNNGPGNIGLGRDNTVTVAGAGIYLTPGESYEFLTDISAAGWPSVWAIADAAGTNVRVEVVG